MYVIILKIYTLVGMLGLPLTSFRSIITLSVLTSLALYIEAKGIFGITPHPWRYFQWLGSVYFLISAMIFYYSILIFKTRLFTIRVLTFWERLLLPIFMSQTLAVGYLLKISLGRSSIKEGGAFFANSFGLFPSGHTLVSLLALTLVVKSVSNLRFATFSSTRWVTFLALLLLLLLALDLFISGDHYLSDIFASSVIYLVFLKLWGWLLSKFQRKV